jgi:hypothetical protein
VLLAERGEEDLLLLRASARVAVLLAARVAVLLAERGEIVLVLLVDRHEPIGIGARNPEVFGFLGEHELLDKDVASGGLHCLRVCASDSTSSATAFE